MRDFTGVDMGLKDPCPSCTDSELARLRAIEQRAGDVGKIAYIAEDAGVVGMVSWNGIARAVSAYLLGKDR